MAGWKMVVEMRGDSHGSSFYVPFTSRRDARIAAVEVAQRVVKGNELFIDIDMETHIRATEIVAVSVEKGGE